MGVFCPFCKTHQGIVNVVTADLSPPKKASDVVARKLACGHVLGSKKYNEFLDQVRGVDQEVAAKVSKLNQEAIDKKAALWEALAEEGGQ